MNKEGKAKVLIFALPMSTFYLTATIIAAIHYSPSNSISTNNLAMWLVFGGWFSYQVMTVVYACCIHSKLKEVTTPVNINFTLHRYGEWVMLLLGESVLSLLIVSLSLDGSYYFTVFMGILTMVIIQGKNNFMVLISLTFVPH